MPHITSPPLDNKLVRELEGRIELFELREFYPGGIGSCLTGPSDQNFSASTGQSALDYVLGLETDAIVLEWRQGARLWRFFTTILLEQPDMKNIMEAYTRRQLQPVCHIAYTIDNFECPEELGA
jgi:hypothetical protein